jgi:hypothetical protein
MALMLFSCGFTFSQENPDEKKKKVRKNSLFDLRNYKPESKDKVIFEMTHCGWLNMPAGVKNDWYSRGANFYLYFDHPFGKSNFSFAWGGGIASHNISGNANVIYQIDSMGNEKTVFEPRELPYRKNIIGAKIVEVPLEFRFRTRRARSFKITLGGKVGYTVQNFRKIFDVDGKRKYFDIHNYNPLRYGVVFRIGYEQIYLCGFYSISHVINKNKGTPNIVPYTLGIGITPW